MNDGTINRMNNGMGTERGKIVYFRLEEGKYAKKHIWNPVKIPAVKIDMGAESSLVFCMVPQYYMGSRPWDEDKLTGYLQSMLDGAECRGCEAYYLQPELGGLIRMKEKLPPEILLRQVFRQVPCWEYLFYIAGEELFLTEEIQEEYRLLLVLLEQYLPRINHFTLIADRPEKYGQFTEYLYEEYGIPTAFMDRMERRFGKDGRTVVLDGRRNYRIPYSVIPNDAAYVDFWSVSGKNRIMEKMRRDVRYMSTVKFLDTLVKNGYNTIVN